MISFVHISKVASILKPLKNCITFCVFYILYEKCLIKYCNSVNNSMTFCFKNIRSLLLHYELKGLVK